MKTFTEKEFEFIREAVKWAEFRYREVDWAEGSITEGTEEEHVRQYWLRLKRLQRAVEIIEEKET